MSSLLTRFLRWLGLIAEPGGDPGRREILTPESRRLCDWSEEPIRCRRGRGTGRIAAAYGITTRSVSRSATVPRRLSTV